MDDTAWLGVDDLGQLLRSRVLSPVELVRARLSRIEQLNPELNAFITITGERALDAAADAEDAFMREKPVSPLAGIPIGLKDAIDLEATRCTFGSRILFDRVSPCDSEVARRLHAAGALIVGKQGMHEFAYGITSENPHFGDVANPWDPDRIAGGSSGGTAASIAAGLAPVGLGTDTGGSIRIPAAMCGVVGLKPTYGLVSRAGVLPLAWSLDHVGPLGLTVLDCFHLLDAVADLDGDQPRLGHARAADQVRELASSGLRGRRVGIPREHFFDSIEPEVEAAVREAVAVLRALGAEIVEVSVPHAVHAQVSAMPIMGAEAAAWHEEWLQRRASDYGEDVLLRLRQGALTRAVDYLKAQQVRTLLRRDFERAFELVDVIASPTVPIVAPHRGRTFERAGSLEGTLRSVINRLTVPANLTGFPAITVPCGTSEGLPLGLQLMGRPHGEPTLGGVALAYERATDWHLARPVLAQ
ncbi:MAG: amidase [Actinomycetota bacterium]